MNYDSIGFNCFRGFPLQLSITSLAFLLFTVDHIITFSFFVCLSVCSFTIMIINSILNHDDRLRRQDHMKQMPPLFAGEQEYVRDSAREDIAYRAPQC